MTGLPPAPDRYASSPAAYAVVALGLTAAVAGAYAVTTGWSVWAVATVVFVCTPLAGLGLVSGRRIRLRYSDWPHPALILTDTARPSCPLCRGEGGWDEPYADADGEYGGEHSIRCDCWTHWTRPLLPVPGRAARLIVRIRRRALWGSSGYSDEPPF